MEELLRWGTGFDREKASLMLTREGAHSRNRILHANGDATGAEIGRSLLAHAREHENITLLEWTTTADLIVEDEGCGRGVAPRPSAKSVSGSRASRAAGQRRSRPGLQRHDEPCRGHRRRNRHGVPCRRGDLPTWSSTSSIPQR